jgi:hypothetical protein
MERFSNRQNNCDGQSAASYYMRHPNNALDTRPWIGRYGNISWEVEGTHFKNFTVEELEPAP